MKGVILPIWIVLISIALIVQSVAFFIAGPTFGSSEDLVYFGVFLILWAILGFLASLKYDLSTGRIIAFTLLFLLAGIIGRGLLEVLFVIPAAIFMIIWTFLKLKE